MWGGEHCVKIGSNTRRTYSYLLELIACEDLTEELAKDVNSEVGDWDEVERGGDQERANIKAVSSKATEQGHEYGDLNMRLCEQFAY
jgi:hypothetical protein